MGSFDTFLSVILGVVVGVLLVLGGNLLVKIRRYKLHQDKKDFRLDELPTVSVCIPARNEDAALTECLQSVLASDYPKLEVLVFDDCSQDQTSSVVRSFAHDGVRFLQSASVTDGWLGKNQAMQTLAEQAVGDYILFLSVDTHLASQSVSRLVQYVQEHKLQMVSVLPQNRLGLTGGTLLGTLQYFWRVALPVNRKHVPVSSKSWLIDADSLRAAGGFAAVSQQVVPEAVFARQLNPNDAYRFIISDTVLGMTTGKKWSSQVETSIRLIYPSVKRNPLLLVLLVLAVGTLFVLPLITSVLFSPTSLIAWLSYKAVFLAFLMYFIVLVRTHPRSWLLSGLLWPMVVVQELILCVVSMIMYQFGRVTWKGRNVCYPVLALPERTSRQR